VGLPVTFGRRNRDGDPLGRNFGGGPIGSCTYPLTGHVGSLGAPSEDGQTVQPPGDLVSALARAERSGGQPVAKHRLWHGYPGDLCRPGCLTALPSVLTRANYSAEDFGRVGNPLVALTRRLRTEPWTRRRPTDRTAGQRLGGTRPPAGLLPTPRRRREGPRAGLRGLPGGTGTGHGVDDNAVWRGAEPRRTEDVTYSRPLPLSLGPPIAASR
jgi:hypothetical protein